MRRFTASCAQLPVYRMRVRAWFLAGLLVATALSLLVRPAGGAAVVGEHVGRMYTTGRAMTMSRCVFPHGG